MKKTLSNRIKVIAIVGPTAGGKTSYAIELAKKINGEIVSADSRLVYKGFNIATAKPTEDEKEGIIHHMMDIVEPTFEYSAGLYKKEASLIIEKINSRGKIPIVVGGTGLYVDLLLQGFDLPKTETNKSYRALLLQKDTDDLFSLLLKKDSDAASRIDKHDRKKVIRALEIINESGQSLNKSRGTCDSPYDIEWIGKNFPRDILYDRINKRVDLMLENGIIEETKNLLYCYGRIDNLINTIGYREIIKYLDRELSLDDSIELLKKNTRNYAKRQLTWFRRNENIKWDIYPDKLKK